MNRNTEMLLGIRRVIKFYEGSLKEVCLRHGLSQMEADILAFLFNNPGKDTASDIVELRMFPKGNVSQAVDALIGKGFLSREKDRNDRRRIHLHLTAPSVRVLGEIMAARKQFQSVLFSGFTQEELSLFMGFNSRIFQNAAAGLEAFTSSPREGESKK